jgi:hypothetical protein
MSDTDYSYEKQKGFVTTDAGQRCLLQVHLAAMAAMACSGAVSSVHLLGTGDEGSSWDQMAVVDALVEIGVLREVGDTKYWQGRVFTKGRRWVDRKKE